MVKNVYAEERLSKKNRRICKTNLDQNSEVNYLETVQKTVPLKKRPFKTLP